MNVIQQKIDIGFVFDIIFFFSCSYINFIKNEFIINEFEFGKPLFPFSNLCYIISKQCANKLIVDLGAIYYHLDFEIGILYLSNQYDYYSCNKNVVTTVYDQTIIQHNKNTILTKTLDLTGYHYVKWLLNINAFTINLTYPISIYLLILVILLILFLKKYKHKKLIITLLIVEICIYGAGVLLMI